jgi:hypothetical protein
VAEAIPYRMRRTMQYMVMRAGLVITSAPITAKRAKHKPMSSMPKQIKVFPLNFFNRLPTAGEKTITATA